MYYENKIWVGNSGDEPVYIEPKMANRHGIIAGATGTGKTVTLKVLAESFSAAGVPVFLADVKGDLSGMINAGTMTEDMQARITRFGLDKAGFNLQQFPSTFWDIFAKGGIPVRTTISEMGPLLLAKLMGLNETQTDLLTVIFKIADDEQLLLIDTKDLKAMLNYVADNAANYAACYGNIDSRSIGVIMRGIVALESQGGEDFFAEPALNIADWFQNAFGLGMINILDCRELMLNGTLYSTFLLWMLSELFEVLPEVGDMDKPRMVFFFDEAHLLFKDISKALQAKIEQVVKLIRSKGVGIFFITQNPSDIPDEVLAQLGNKIQHALRAYTPKEEKAIKSVAASFRINPEFDTKEVLSQLGTGEALVSTLGLDGVPGIVKKVNILPPQSAFGGITEEVRNQEILRNNYYLKYKDMYDRDSAYEFLKRQTQSMYEEYQAKLAEEQRLAEEEKQRVLEEKAAEKERIQKEKEEEREKIRQEKEEEREKIRQEKEEEREKIRQEKAEEKARADELKAKEREAKALERKKELEEKAAARAKAQKEKQMTNVIKKTAQSAGGTVGREIGNSIGKSVGGTFGKKLGGNVGATFTRNLLGTFFKS